MYHIHYQNLQGSVQIPASKSLLQRALAAGLLTLGESQIRHLSESKDCLAATQIIRALGATVEREGDQLWVWSKGVRPPQRVLDCGESGLALRMFTPIAALAGGRLRLEGEGSLLRRPIGFFEQHLPLFGVRVQTQWGYLPMEISGQLQAANARIDGSQSSQYLTGLLMALPCCAGDSELEVQQLQSRPYIDLTLQVLQHFGIQIEHYQYKAFFVRGNQVYTPQTYTIEGDWSAAAFWLVAGALGGEIEVAGLNLDSAQADSAICSALEQAGVSIRQTAGGQLQAIGDGTLRAFDFDASQCPDLFPPLVALAAHCAGESRIYGVSRLVDKESNRAVALQTEFGKMGIQIRTDGDWMRIIGGSRLQSAVLDAHNDHRIAMAVAIAGRGLPLQITGYQAVEKSYPQFWQDLERLSVRER